MHSTDSILIQVSGLYCPPGLQGSFHEIINITSSLPKATQQTWHFPVVFWPSVVNYLVNLCRTAVEPSDWASNSLLNSWMACSIRFASHSCNWFSSWRQTSITLQSLVVGPTDGWEVPIAFTCWPWIAPSARIPWVSVDLRDVRQPTQGNVE